MTGERMYIRSPHLDLQILLNLVCLLQLVRHHLSNKELNACPNIFLTDFE